MQLKCFWHFNGSSEFEVINLKWRKFFKISKFFYWDILWCFQDFLSIFFILWDFLKLESMQRRLKLLTFSDTNRKNYNRIRVYFWTIHSFMIASIQRNKRVWSFLLCLCYSRTAATKAKKATFHVINKQREKKFKG